MTNPPERRTVQVSADVHARLFELADALGISGEAVIRRLVDPSTVHIACTPTQRHRWQLAADTTGMRLEEWAALQIERTLQSPDRETVNQIFYRVDLLCQKAGVALPSTRRPLTNRQDD